MNDHRDDIAGIWLAQDDGRETAQATDVDALARCDTVMALVPQLKDHPDVAWAFDEAQRLARSGPDRARMRRLWLRPAMLGWGVAGIAASACLVLVVLLTQSGPAGSPTAPTAAENASPTSAGGLPAGFESRMAEIDPVFVVGDVNVDGRSIAIMPFADAGPNTATADQLYRNVTQLATQMGFYVAGSDAAAAYADTEYTSEEIAAYLGVRSIVTANLDTSGERVSVDLHITDASGSSPGIERRFERPLTEIDRLESEITASLIDALGTSRQATEPNSP